MSRNFILKLKFWCQETSFEDWNFDVKKLKTKVWLEETCFWDKNVWFAKLSSPRQHKISLEKDVKHQSMYDDCRHFLKKSEEMNFENFLNKYFFNKHL